MGRIVVEVAGGGDKVLRVRRLEQGETIFSQHAQRLVEQGSHMVERQMLDDVETDHGPDASSSAGA
jgi:hypothetical protein